MARGLQILSFRVITQIIFAQYLYRKNIIQFIRSGRGAHLK